MNKDITMLSLTIEQRISGALQTALNRHENVPYELVNLYYNMSITCDRPLKVLIAGEAKTGKSTLINALLKKEVLKSDVVPTTSAVTYLCYGEEEYIQVVFKNGSSGRYPMEDLHELTVEKKSKYSDIRDYISAVYVYMNIPLLKSITIVDSPGINVLFTKHIEATQSVMNQVDCIIWVMSVHAAGKRSEIDEISKLPKELKPFVVLNRIDILDPDETNVDDAIERMGERIQDYCTGYVAISAYLALKYYLYGNVEDYKESRFEQFLNVLSNDLKNRRNMILESQLIRQLKERKQIVNQQSQVLTEQETQQLGKWLYKNRECQKILTAQSIYQQRKFIQATFKQYQEMNNQKQILSLLENFHHFFELTSKELELYIRIHGRKNYYAMIKKYLTKQSEDCSLLYELCMKNDESKIDWNLYRLKIYEIMEHINEIQEIVDKSMFDVSQEDQQKASEWHQKYVDYQSAIGYEFELDILTQLSDYI